MNRRAGSTKDEIVKLLRQRGSLTAGDLAREVGITSVAVRQHLDVLTASGLVAAATERRPIGRPRRVYSLTERADELFPKAYHTLANVILEQLQERVGGGGVLELFDDRRRWLERQYRPRVEGKCLAERVATVAQIQEENGYMAEWEQRDDGSFVLREHNCPICKVACNFPQACQKEMELLANLLDADITREQHMARGDRMCSYVIRSLPRPDPLP
jgi:predicted ArsR family transcriptional regulator